MYSVRQTTWDHIWSPITVEKSKKHATSVLMHATIKVFWGHIWKLAVEKWSNYHKSATLRSIDWQKIFHMWNVWKCIHSSFKPQQAYRHHRGEKRVNKFIVKSINTFNKLKEIETVSRRSRPRSNHTQKINSQCSRRASVSTVWLHKPSKLHTSPHFG